MKQFFAWYHRPIDQSGVKEKYIVIFNPNILDTTTWKVGNEDGLSQIFSLPQYYLEAMR